MSAFLLKRLLFCLSGLFLFSSCQTTNTQEKPPETHPQISSPLPAPSEVWDTSDVDISYIQENKKLISFTFDDTPTPFLENLLAVFAEYNENNPDCKATATIFCNGVRFDENTPLLLHAALALGFELGNHSYSHFDLTKLDEPSLRSEIDKTDELLQKIDKKPRHLLRAPYGKTNELIKQTAETPIIDWTIDTLDWTGKEGDEICQTVLDHAFDGAIVLLHDGFDNTLYAVKKLLPLLKELNYQAVSVSALSKAHSVPMKRGSSYIRLRKRG